MYFANNDPFFVIDISNDFLFLLIYIYIYSLSNTTKMAKIRL